MPAVTDRPTRPEAADIAQWVPTSSGCCDCPGCGQTMDYLSGVTPCGLCPGCAASIHRSPPATPYSDPFWLLTPEEIERAATELQRLHTAAMRLECALPKGDWGHEEAPIMDAIRNINRETMLLALLREASRQFRASGDTRFQRTDW
jgi:hypothetical protein